MCKYFKKKFTCGHLSNVYVDRCLDACRPGNEACTPAKDSDHDPEAFKETLDQTAKLSHFACFPCLKSQAHAELSAAAAADAAAEQDPLKRAEIMDKQARYASKLAKANANRKAAEAKMQLERAADAAAAEARAAEKERAARGEGSWTSVETGSMRRKRGRQGYGHGKGFVPAPKPISTQGTPMVPMPSPTILKRVDAGVGGRAGKMGEFRNEPRTPKEVDGTNGGGAWPKKVLTRGSKGMGESTRGENVRESANENAKENAKGGWWK